MLNMGRRNIIIPTHLEEYWDSLDNKSGWVQQKLEDELDLLEKDNNEDN